MKEISRGLYDGQNFVEVREDVYLALIGGLEAASDGIQKLAIEARDRGLYAQQKDLEEIATRLRKTAEFLTVGVTETSE